MKIVIPKERSPDERRVPMIPPDVKQLVKLGAQVEIEKGMGESVGYADDEYMAAGATISADRKTLLSSADVVVRLHKPAVDEISWLKKGSIHISYLDPSNEPEILDKFVSRGISAISMEMIPRVTRAQKMDVLSSQASLAGYVAVIIAAERSGKIFPMMMTPAGTIAPVRVFVIGVGVAGLQAIATAKRLGARVDAFDTRPVVEEQVRSLGARFVKIDLGETGETKDGYAKALTEEQIEMQRREMAKHCAIADVVITTAQVFGRKAPLIVTREMITGMKNGSIIIDLAAESGGNVEGTIPGEEICLNGVKIIGLKNAANQVAQHASQMYSSNILSFITEFWDDETKSLKPDLDDEIIKGCLVTHESKIFSEALKRHT
ncbi:MAG: Re/Si-specific NAD(P)(+) transhydrogenase subunit alpha [Deltaproteobacteria bacterium]|nr:Re/Si-specific NAD(P)(+) transhydrogenase subunit alpha [Deltaproteobacteria bacterium]